MEYIYKMLIYAFVWGSIWFIAVVGARELRALFSRKKTGDIGE